MLGTVSDVLASSARNVGIVAAVALLTCARIVFGQGLAEVWTDKSVYLEG